MSAVMQRTCRKQRTTEKFNQGDIILGSKQSVVEEVVGECSSHEGRGLLYVKVCEEEQ